MRIDLLTGEKVQGLVPEMAVVIRNINFVKVGFAKCKPNRKSLKYVTYRTNAINFAMDVLLAWPSHSICLSHG